MIRKTLAIALTGLCILGVSTANALPLNLHGVGFQAGTGTDQQFINRSGNGVVNTAAVSKHVWVAPPRNPHAAGNQQVSITGWHSSLATNTRCTIATYSNFGALIHSRSFCMGGAAGCINPAYVPAAPPAHWIRNELFSTVQAPSTASYVVWCTLLPPGVNTNHIDSVRVSP